jgi:hypothetical protein
MAVWVLCWPSCNAGVNVETRAGVADIRVNCPQQLCDGTDTHALLLHVCMHAARSSTVPACGRAVICTHERIMSTSTSPAPVAHAAPLAHAGRMLPWPCCTSNFRPAKPHSPGALEIQSNVRSAKPWLQPLSTSRGHIPDIRPKKCNSACDHPTIPPLVQHPAPTSTRMWYDAHLTQPHPTAHTTRHHGYPGCPECP